MAKGWWKESLETVRIGTCDNDHLFVTEENTTFKPTTGSPSLGELQMLHVPLSLQTAPYTRGPAFKHFTLELQHAHRKTFVIWEDEYLRITGKRQQGDSHSVSSVEVFTGPQALSAVVIPQSGLLIIWYLYCRLKPVVGIFLNFLNFIHFILLQQISVT